jgi:hypothetical protein
MPNVRSFQAIKYHMSALHGITCHGETLIPDTIPPCLLAADVAPANRNSEVDHPAKPSCHDVTTCMQDELSKPATLYVLLDSFSAVYHMLAPGRQPVWYSKLSHCKGVFMTRMSPAFCMQCKSSSPYNLYIAHSLRHYEVVTDCPPFADDPTGWREGEMSWHKRLTRSRAPSQTLRFLYLCCLDLCTSPPTSTNTY